MTSRCIGGWNADINPRFYLFQVTIRTSIDDWDEYILAHTEKEVKEWVQENYPGPHSKGFEPTVTRIYLGLGSVYIVTNNPLLLHPEIPEIL